jgi:hypothetical protein
VFRFSAKAESIFAGIFYVGCSRVEDESCLAFDAPFTRVVAEKVGNYETSRQARMAMQKVARLAARQRQRHDRDHPARTFEAGLRWFCGHVIDKVSTEDTGLQDVVALCEHWLDGLGPREPLVGVDAGASGVDDEHASGPEVGEDGDLDFVEDDVVRSPTLAFRVAMPDACVYAGR